jgi:hypothetical protein
MPNRATLLAEAEVEPALNNVFDTVLDAYRSDGFEAGYHRAVNDLLADFALIAKEFLRERENPSDELRHALRDFQMRFEAHMENAMPASRTVDQYVDGGLGI